MKIDGLDALTRKMEELEKALSELDGDIAHVTFDADDPESLELAIRTVSSAVDDKVSAYSHNDLVMSVAEELKERYRTAILDRATAARLDGGDGK